jgi:hypothetical protein
MLAARLGQCAAGHAHTRGGGSAAAAARRVHKCVSAAIQNSASPSSSPSVAVRSFRRSVAVSAARWTPPGSSPFAKDEPEKEPTDTETLIDAMSRVVTHSPGVRLVYMDTPPVINEPCFGCKIT